jgi:hypothetical protein
MSQNSSKTNETVLANNLKGIKTNFPRDGFDALEASDDDLRTYFLPPRPNAQKTPIAFANWQRVMATRPAYPKLVPEPRLGRDVRIRTRPNKSPTHASSRNWSGSMVRPWNRDDMSLVQGRWIVPETSEAKTDEAFSVSAWVGIDGYDPASRLMPQIGTGFFSYVIRIPSPAGDLIYRQTLMTAWWQVWRRQGELSTGDLPLPQWQVEIPVPIEMGERIYGQVQVIDDYTVSLFLKNETTNSAYAAFYDMRCDYTGTNLIPFECRTAEWIVERPMIPFFDDASRPWSVPLADYGEISFTDCNAATLATDGTWTELQMQRARLVRMNEWDDVSKAGHIALSSQFPGRLNSMPRRIDDDVLDMTFIDPP